MDQEIPLRVLEDSNPPSSRENDITQDGSVDMAPTPSVSSSSSSSLRKTFNGLSRELRDYIYELVYDEDLYVVLGRRGILPVGSQRPSHPDSTSQITSKHRVIYPGSHPSFGAKIVDSHVDPVSEPEQAEMTAYGAAHSARGLLWRAMHQALVQALFYKRCTFLFEDFELSTKFLSVVSSENLNHISKIEVYYSQEAEGSIKAIQAIGDHPDLGSFYEQSNAFLPDAESRLRRALVSFDADPTDDHALAYNIATQGTTFYQSLDDPNRPVCVPSSLFPPRWLFGVMCRLLVVSMEGVNDLTIWIGDTLELEFNAHRDEVYEAALLQFAAMGNVDAVSVKKWVDAFDNLGDEDARWHVVNFMKIRTLNGVEEMIRCGEHGALDRHAMMMPDA
ncbi:hypothetical protein Q7P36_008994 [Cladosporium allicinum]